MAVFYLKKKVIPLRINLLLKILGLKQTAQLYLGQEAYLIRRMEQLTFNKKTLKYVENTKQLWNSIRKILLENLDTI